MYLASTMKFFTNKFFIFGVLLLLAISIPLTLFFVRRQQDLRSSAAPTTTLAISPTSQTASAGEEVTVEVTVDPGENFVSFVEFSVVYDATYLEALSIDPNTDAFPLILGGPTITAETASMSVGIGSDVTKAIQQPTTVATIRFRTVAPTGGTPTQVIFETDVQALSLSIDDQPGENVIANTSPATITILGDSTPSPTPTSPPQASPTPLPSSTPAPTATPLPSPTPVAANQAPVCTGLTASPSPSGAIPFTVDLTAVGSDPDGLISKATFNFGDGDVADVFDGLQTQSVSVLQSHTYANLGSYTATVIFTDNSGSISQACTIVLTATDGGGGSIPTSTPLPTKPPIADPGGLLETVGIAGAVVVTIIGGALLLTL